MNYLDTLVFKQRVAYTRAINSIETSGFLADSSWVYNRLLVDQAPRDSSFDF